jgi:hypothetical protein
MNENKVIPIFVSDKKGHIVTAKKLKALQKFISEKVYNKNRATK